MGVTVQEAYLARVGRAGMLLLPMITALIYQGQTAAATLRPFDAKLHFGDGMNIFGFFRDMNAERIGARVRNRDGENTSEHGEQRMRPRVQSDHQSQRCNDARR